METEACRTSRRRIGVYTKTVVRTPVVRWILHARIRHRHCKDVIFVGEDFVEIKEIGLQGDLQHIAIKLDFDARIRNAKVFETEDAEQDFLVKLELERKPDTRYPPQLLALTLDSNDLVFVYYYTDQDGTSRFVQQSCPMPSFDRILFQPGEHLAVDPLSRALAVAGNEREVILYSAKTKEHLQREISTRSRDWCPVSGQRPWQVAGVIHHMDFLVPPAEDQDNVILLLIVTDQSRVKAVLIEWHCSHGLMHAEQHSGQPLGTHMDIPNLLIPLRDATFLLATGDNIVRYKDILTGSYTRFELTPPDTEAQYLGTSPLAPTWTSWTKPRRSQAAIRDKDFVYLAREDGMVYLFEIDVRNTVQISDAGNLYCHVGTAFASLGDEGDPDILAVAGETSNGSVVSIGIWPTTRPVEELSREDTMTFDPIDMLTNWASVTDMVSCRRIQSSRALTSNTDMLFVTSGRQPFGHITEMRTGLEARLAQSVSLDFLQQVTDLWALPNTANGCIILVLSMLDETRLIELTPNLQEADLGDLSAISALDRTLRTIFVGITASYQIVQVTNRGVCTSGSLSANFEDTSNVTIDPDDSILAAALVTDESILVTAEQHGATYLVCFYVLPSLHQESTIDLLSTYKLTSMPLCLAAQAYGDEVIAVVATNDGHITSVMANKQGVARSTPATQVTHVDSDLSVCDSLVILRSTRNLTPTPQLLVSCGLRNGMLVTCGVTQDGSLIHRQEVELGQSRLRLFPINSNVNSAIATTDAQTCRIRWDGQETSTLEIENIWVVDKQEPDYAQGPVIAVTQLPSAAFLGSEVSVDALVLISGEDILIAYLRAEPSAVVRQMPVTGSPNRVIHSESLRSLVCSGLFAEVRLLPSRPHSAPVEKRQIWPVIDFLPDRGGQSYSHAMQPGERINALLEWTYRPGDEKTYSHILVGGSYVRQSGARRGRVTFLQPINNRSWEIASVTERSRDTYDENDVYALALYDSVTYIACAGEKVYMKRYEQKWNELCSPFKLASPGVRITVETTYNDQKMIVISTMRDSLVTVKLASIPESDHSSPHRYKLHALTMAPRADTLLHHLVLSPTPDTDEPRHITLMSTKYAQLLGLSSSLPNSSATPPSRPTSSTLIFEAQLPRSLTRLTKTPVLKRKGSPPSGLLPDHITGCTTDGSLVSIVLLESYLWRRLSWLQRLIEWSEELSPHSFASPAYSVGNADSFTGRERALPIGFSGQVGDLAVVQTNYDELMDMHVDGDVLARVLRRGGKEAIKVVLEELAGQDDGIGVWVRENLDGEMGRLDELVDLVRKVDAWM